MQRQLVGLACAALLAACGSDCPSSTCGACQSALTVRLDFAGAMLGGEAMVRVVPLEPEVAPIACAGALPTYQCDITPGRYRLEVMHPVAGDFVRELTIAPDGGGCCACGHVPQTVTATFVGFGDAGLDGSTVDGSAMDAGASDASDASSPDSGPPPACVFASPRPPPTSVLWPSVLSATGAETLRGHGHDDSFGAVGYCPGTPVSGQPFYRLVAAGFETDEDVTGDGDQNDPVPVDFWRDGDDADAVGESGGRINIFVDVVDASGAVLRRDDVPELRFERTILDGPTDLIPIDAKPDTEFQTHIPMTGGGTRYGLAVEGASDRVINMRLPVNHHVTFQLVFERVDP